MYAIVETGGKQFLVEQGAKIIVEKLEVKPGDEITLDRVLMVGGEDRRIGAPLVEGASVTAEVLAQGRRPKVLVFKGAAARIPRPCGGTGRTAHICASSR